MITKESWLKSIMAGICIGVGGIVYLSLDNKMVGCGAVCQRTVYPSAPWGITSLPERLAICRQRTEGKIPAVAAADMGGQSGWSGGNRLPDSPDRAGSALAEKAQGLCETKLSDSLLSIVILAVFCNLMIYIAVENFKSNPHTLGKYLAIFLGVMVFILAGFEHCVANMFYFSVANMWSLRTVLYLLVMTAGNAVGGMIPEMVRRVSAPQK